MCQSLYHQARYWMACQLQRLGFQAKFLLPPWPILGDGTPFPKEWCLLPRVRLLPPPGNNSSFMLSSPSSSSCSTSPSSRSSSPFIAPSAIAPSLSLGHHLHATAACSCNCLPDSCYPSCPCPCPMSFGGPRPCPYPCPQVLSAACHAFRCIPPPLADPALTLDPISKLERHYYYSPSPSLTPHPTATATVTAHHLIPAPSVSMPSSSSSSSSPSPLGSDQSPEDKWKRQGGCTTTKEQLQLHDSSFHSSSYTSRITDFNATMAILSVLLAVLLYFVVITIRQPNPIAL
jgi:hypothetical protein